MNIFSEEKLNKVYEYIIEYQKKQGRTPSYREIMNNCRLGSISTVHRNINELKKRGRIEEQKDSKWRSISISQKLALDEVDNTPLVGEVACGEPLLAIENILGNYPLPIGIFGKGEKFMLKAKGYSMIEKGIDPGDILVVRKQNYATPGQIVIALIEDEATAKIFLPQESAIILRAANSNTNEDGEKIYKDIKVKNCEILGIVTNVIKCFE